MFAVSELPASVTEKHPLLASTVKDSFAKSQLYGAAKHRFGMIKGVYDVAFTVCLLVLGVLPKLWSFSRNLLGGDSRSEITVSLGFAAIAMVAQMILELPWGIYSTFVLEQRFGFNKQTASLYAIDTLKSLGLTAAIGAPVLSAVIAIIRWAGNGFWLPLWLFLLVVSLGLATAYPTLILPIFNKLSPLPEGPLREAVVELAARTSFPLKDISTMDGSKRSAHSNAFIAGMRNKRIVLFDTLINQMTVPELTAVLGHEIGHWQRSHMWKTLAVSELHSLLFLFLASRFVTDAALFSDFGFNGEQPVVIGLSLFAMAYGPIESAFSILINAVSRKHEYEADAFATVQCHTDLATPLIKLHAENLSTLLVDPLFSFFHFSHPTLLERLHAIDQVSHKTQ